MKLENWLPWSLIAVWLVIQAFWSLPAEIATDWNGWRQTDTQSIAVNFIRYGDNILYPRVNWGGSGPGYVEAEFQLYTYSSSLLMRWFGVSERPGQWISLVSVAVAAISLFFCIRRRMGFVPAMLALLFFLSARGTIFTSSVVQPDALSFMFCTLSFVAFLRYLEVADARSLVMATASLMLAALVKPTALHLGVFQFLSLLWLRRDLLLKRGIWIAWATIFLGVGLQFWHGHSLFQQFGNTFGVGLVGDSKFPTLPILADPGSYKALIHMSLAWGFGWAGVAAGLYLLLRRQFDALSITLGVANLVLLIVAFRYTSNEWYGPHYHVVTVLLASWLVALAARDLFDFLPKPAWRKVTFAVLSVLLLFSWGEQLEYRKSSSRGVSYQLNSVAAGKYLRNLLGPDDLVVVRSLARARDERYNTVNNFEDPILLYVAGARGWVLPADEPKIEVLEAALGAGAKFYVSTSGRVEPPALEAWLDQHADRIAWEPKRYEIYRLRS